jgi:hypothetical protein
VAVAVSAETRVTEVNFMFQAAARELKKRTLDEQKERKQHPARPIYLAVSTTGTYWTVQGLSVVGGLFRSLGP